MVVKICALTNAPEITVSRIVERFGAEEDVKRFRGERVKDDSLITQEPVAFTCRTREGQELSVMAEKPQARDPINNVYSSAFLRGTKPTDRVGLIAAADSAKNNLLTMLHLAEDNGELLDGARSVSFAVSTTPGLRFPFFANSIVDLKPADYWTRPLNALAKYYLGRGREIEAKSNQTVLGLSQSPTDTRGICDFVGKLLEQERKLDSDPI